MNGSAHWGNQPFLSLSLSLWSQTLLSLPLFNLCFPQAGTELKAILGKQVIGLGKRSTNLPDHVPDPAWWFRCSTNSFTWNLTRVQNKARGRCALFPPSLLGLFLFSLLACGPLGCRETSNRSDYKMSVYQVPRVVRFTETESRVVMPGAGRGGGGDRKLFRGYRVSVWEDETFWKWTVVMGAQRCECTSCHWISRWNYV